jgi:hypothetical protein
MEQNPKTQAVERLREAQNVLITVNNNPTVDQLCACVGFTLLLNKLGKHATAVFSGQIPSTIEFLKPEDTLEQNTDSLRDFIIALDKAKADKLRYKVEEDVVRIFITPYRTSINEQDLDFSQGDFNVDAVVALGVDARDHIDQAITTHGRILHDATVIGLMAGGTPVDVGGINWQEQNASSLCEMLVGISEALKGGLIDSQIATAFLTGIVAQTERFSNDKTSPKVMTISAQLMAAGANQQLIATKLELPTEPTKQPVPQEEPQTNPDEEGVLNLHDDKLPIIENDLQNLSEDEIRIDEHGMMSAGDQKDEVETQENTLNPASQQVEKNYSKYVSEPPKTGGVLTANSEPETLESSSDPASTSDQETDIGFSAHGKDLEPIAKETQASGIKQTDNLQNIESSVNKNNTDIADESNARNAVQKAVDGDFNPDMPEPIQSLNAQEFTFDGDDNNAPPVPPPIVPPFRDQQDTK